MADRTWDDSPLSHRAPQRGFPVHLGHDAYVVDFCRPTAEPVCGHCHGSGRSQGLCCSGDTCGKCNPGGAKAEQATQMAPAAPWLRADAVCPACQGTGTKTTADRLAAEQAATAARARSPVAALLKQYSHNISVPIWDLRAAIDQQRALWQEDALGDEGVYDPRGVRAAYAEALRNCASDLSGSTGER